MAIDALSDFVVYVASFLQISENTSTVTDITSTDSSDFECPPTPSESLLEEMQEAILLFVKEFDPNSVTDVSKEYKIIESTGVISQNLQQFLDALNTIKWTNFF